MQIECRAINIYLFHKLFYRRSGALYDFARRYAECTAEQQEAVREYYPVRLSEGEIEGEGGRR